MKKTIIPLALFIICMNCLQAQPITGVSIFSKIGYTSLPGLSSTLNKIVPGNNFSNNFITAGAECYYRINKLIIALDGNIGVQKAVSNSAEKPAVSIGTTYTRFGWIIDEKKHHWIYPSVGCGVAAIDAHTYDYANDEADNLKNKLNWTPSFDLGFNADFIMRKISDLEDHGTMLLGVRTGYRVSIKNKAWRDNDNKKISNMPPYAQNGFYLMVTIGSGVFFKN